MMVLVTGVAVVTGKTEAHRECPTMLGRLVGSIPNTRLAIMPERRRENVK